MNFLPSFVAWPFAVAGAVAAAGPIVIHLLNRRRHRTVHWAAMDFLREALQRNRRILQMRDVLLLILRTAAVLLVGLALAQPFFSGGNERFDGTEPLHAVLIIDNSLSMGFETLEGTFLDRAKVRARGFVDRLPADSRVTVIPLCGSGLGASPDAATKESSLLALDRVEIVDRSADVTRAVSEGVRACESGPTLARRLVFFSDQQARNWRDAGQALHAAPTEGELPPIQFVDVSAGQPGNTWISDLRVQDGLADVETPATIIAQVRYQGTEARRDVDVRLNVDDVEVASRVVTLERGQGVREISFQHLFDSHPVEPGRSTAVPVRVSIAADNLPQDDERFVTVPVVAGLPVVFVDQYGAEREDPVRRRVGETRPLRRLLAPVSNRAAETRQLVQVRHIRLDQLSRDILEDARLVVVAGIADPSGAVSLLRQYVRQGGQLVIAAGGEHDPVENAGFDPTQWTTAAWLDGAGILPGPLLTDPIGTTLQEAGASELTPFFLSFDSLYAHQYFQLAGISEQQMRDLYAEPLFFKAVRLDESEQALRQLYQYELQRLTDRYTLAAEPGATAGGAAAGDLAADHRPVGVDGDTRWLLWRSPATGVDDHSLPANVADRERMLKELAALTKPRTLARFGDAMQTPYLVSRKIGRGDVLFASSGLLAEWNTLATTNAVLLFDRILRQMILSTLPRRNFEPGGRITLPLPSAERDITITLHRPGRPDQREVLDTGFIGRSQYGFNVDQPLSRGLYRVAAFRADNAADAVAGQPIWTMPLAVNGPAEESELRTFSREQFEEQTAGANASWVGPDEDISLAGTQIRGQNSWWWLIVAVLGLLMLELALLAGFSSSTAKAATAR